MNGEADQALKKKLLKQRLGNFDEYIFTGWMFSNAFTDLSNRSAWACRWKTPIYTFDLFKIGDMPTPRTSCPCSTPIVWNYLIKHVRTGRLEFVGSTCMKYFDNKRRCVKCLVVNRCKTVHCQQCRVKCQLHKQYHDDNSTHKRIVKNGHDFAGAVSADDSSHHHHYKRLVERFDKLRSEGHQRMLTLTLNFGHIRHKYIQDLFDSSELNQAQKNRLVELLPYAELQIGKYKGDKYWDVKSRDISYYNWLKRTWNYRFVRYLP
ncbi:unnamed protein product [Phytophthora fragariaefolia]|uniref:Unnamed protein product n=1 Tax=Phytophthora fragariaefolia TaxID=1490495 RepID=A0A9W7CYX6_9STRA|nr:unnamed protein product [Phytophthora fragariaefolia]